MLRTNSDRNEWKSWKIPMFRSEQAQVGEEEKDLLLKVRKNKNTFYMSCVPYNSLAWSDSYFKY